LSAILAAYIKIITWSISWCCLV